MEPLIVVSADSHASGPTDMFRPYLEERYHPDLDELAGEEAELWNAGLASTSYFFPEVLDIVDEENAMRSGGRRGGWDRERRLIEMDREGVAAEVIQPATKDGVELFHGTTNKARSPELRHAGARAWNRWLADALLSNTDGRLLGSGAEMPCVDMDETVAELEWLADNDFVAVAPPLRIIDDSLPALSDRYYEPFWAKCAEGGLALQIHAGYSCAQGVSVGFGRMRIKTQRLAMVPDLRILSGDTETDDSNLAVTHAAAFASFRVGPRRAFWQMMLGGVFDRHPDLKLFYSELRIDWVAPMLAHLDARNAKGDIPLAKKPSEYWASNVYACATAPTPAELEMRHEIGIDNIMFGRDYPHHDGTWPFTKDWIRAGFERVTEEVTEEEVRKILGENAIYCFKLDREKLAKIATRIGPRPEELLGQTVDPRKVECWDDGSHTQFLAPVDRFDADEFDTALDKDLQAMSLAR